VHGSVSARGGFPQYIHVGDVTNMSCEPLTSGENRWLVRRTVQGTHSRVTIQQRLHHDPADEAASASDQHDASFQ
jgi:hypothetical protein